MSSRTPLPRINLTSTWLHRWIYYLAAGLMFTAAALRAFIILRQDPRFGETLLLLAAWLILFILNAFLPHLPPSSAVVFLSLQASLILYLLLASGQDFFAFLFAVISMQAMQRFTPRTVGGLIALFAVLTFLSLVGPVGVLQALALALIYAALGALMSAYIWSTRCAGVVQEKQQTLVRELQETNAQLEFHAHQQEQLAIGRERQRLARELHDSVTQTIFSMTLTTQSAILLLDRNRGQVAAQLDRLDQLVQSAMAEMQVLISRLTPDELTEDGFVSALRRHLEERRRLENLIVEFEVEGSQRLDPLEESGLFRITQEALNNVVKHAGVLHATVRLHLTEPFWMEVEDRGAGFDPLQFLRTGKLGIAGMRERATEIGWSLRVESVPGGGTRVRVDKNLGGEKQI
ncbi:MAG: sensor histidine kinase [Anaerolineaceae bacterium]|nr:sensor histidine kinase [Anaerolineaceae bacterium]